MIEGTSKGTARNPVAVATCDDCGTAERVVCEYEGGKPHQGQVLRKLKGWSFIKHRLRCPDCDQTRREDAMTEKNITDIRQPSRYQRWEIVSILGEVYDTGKERYIGGETDKTVAETIGGGCMPGWVAEIREAMFGPDGGNTDLEDLRDEVRAWMEKADAQAAEASRLHQASVSALREFNDSRGKVKELSNRIEAIKIATGEIEDTRLKQPAK